jgi:adenosine deaminase
MIRREMQRRPAIFISGLTLSEEYHRTALAGRLGPAELWEINLSSLDGIFAEDAVKRALKEEFRAWARGVSELCPGP